MIGTILQAVNMRGPYLWNDLQLARRRGPAARDEVRTLIDTISLQDRNYHALKLLRSILGIPGDVLEYFVNQTRKFLQGFSGGHLEYNQKYGDETVRMNE
jgi:hypothetical protein